MIRVVLLFWALAAPVGAQTLAEVAGELARHPGVPGAVVGVVTAEGAGFEVAGKRETLIGGPVTRDDQWHIGSLTKAMTATLAARLVERGLIAWDTPIGEVLPNAGRHAEATLEELLTHRSGLPANLPGPVATNSPDRAFYVRAGLRMPVARGRRGEFRYSNVGYVVAGAMLEAVAGAPWEELVAREVFKPLGMEGMGFGAPPLNRGHAKGPRAVAPGPRADNPAVMAPAGTAHATPDDLIAFLTAHLAWDEAYLSPNSWERMHLAAEGSDYALGWVAGDEGRLIHTGSNTLWWAVMEVDHAKGQALFVAVNAGDQRAVRAPVLKAVLALRDFVP